METESRSLAPIAVLVLATACLSMPIAQASDEDDKDRRAAAPLPGSSAERDGRRFYAGVALGNGYNSDFVAANDDGSLGAIRADKSDAAWQIHVGWQINDYFSLEAGHVDLGKVHFDANADGTGISWAGPGAVSTDLEADGWYGGLRGEMPMGERWKLFLSLSWFRWHSKETFVDNGFVSTDEESGGDMRYGTGAEFDIGQHDKWVLRAEMNRTKVDNDEDAVTTATVGMTRRF